MKLDTKTIKKDGYTIRISIHHDDNMGAPWEEHDGHGIASDWTSRDKRAGEIILCQDGSSKRYYDFADTMKIAKRDGWGLCPEKIAKIKKQTGKKPTKGELVHAAVMADFEYLRAWCNDEWHWLGYTTEIETPDGETIDGDSCWGYDDERYMLEQATSNALATVADHAKTGIETEIAACYP